jgi:hypothetical protein
MFLSTDEKPPPASSPPKINGEITQLMVVVWNQISPQLSPLLTQTNC